MLRLLVLFWLLLPITVFAQRTCPVNNLWQNGDFEDSSLVCLMLNPKNAYWNQANPWKGYTLLRWQPTYDLQPSYLDEPDTDHTLGTDKGHYYYLDPRQKSGWDYEFQQDIQVEKNTNYNYSMWYCSMNKSGNPEANIRLAVNGTAITSQEKIVNTFNTWIKISGVWNSGNSTLATASLQTYNASVSGHDFAIDDIVFGTGKLVVFAGNDTVFCTLNTANLGVKDAAKYGVSCKNTYTYEWQPATNIDGSNTLENPKLMNPIIPGWYTLTIKDNNGNECTDSINISIKTYSIAVVDILKDSIICAGKSVTRSIPNFYSGVLWNDGSKNFSRALTDTGLYIVEFYKDCTKYIDSFRIGFKPPVREFWLDDTTLCANMFVSHTFVDTSGEYTILWNNGSTQHSQIMNSSGTYWAKITGECGSFTDTFTITIDDKLCNCELFAANVFTPGHDGFNDIFDVRADCPFVIHSLNIFNRWGELMFKTEKIGEGWNGFCGQIQCPEGVYFYQAEVRFSNSMKTLSINGPVHLIRE